MMPMSYPGLMDFYSRFLKLNLSHSDIIADYYDHGDLQGIVYSIFNNGKIKIRSSQLHDISPQELIDIHLEDKVNSEYIDVPVIFRHPICEKIDLAGIDRSAESNFPSRLLASVNHTVLRSNFIGRSKVIPFYNGDIAVVMYCVPCSPGKYLSFKASFPKDAYFLETYLRAERCVADEHFLDVEFQEIRPFVPDSVLTL